MSIVLKERIYALYDAFSAGQFETLSDMFDERVDFAAHARSLGAQAEHVQNRSSLEKALKKAIKARKTSVVVIDTDARRGTAEGGAWWDVAVTAAPRSASQRKARSAYEAARRRQAAGA
jgi:3D-(3,5/4)-trihydroxycyclohexane-1,2-dione acylhydrolase (decyclizing)